MVTRWKKELRTGTLHTGLARALLTVSLWPLVGVFTHGGALAATRIANSTLGTNFGSLATTSCTTDDECVDNNACLQGTCAEGICEFHELPDCVPCFDPPTCPPVDIVFLMDTSGSMVDEATALCQNVNQVVLDLAANGVLVTPHFLGITETPAEGFDCLTDDVVTMLGGAVPGDAASCPFPDTFSAHESWGPATAIVAERFPWGDAVVRMIVPISDEGPCDGSFPDGCNDPGDDRDSITNAIAVANANDVIVSPISGTSSSQCVLTLASALATGTGGMAFASQDPNADLAAALIEIVSDVCEPTPCDDGNICTGDDLCVDGVCLGTPLPDCCTTAAECDDANACTDDLCVNNTCGNTDNFDPLESCCNTIDGSLTPIDDGETCTDDTCDAVTGEVTHSPTAEQIACDDGDICTYDVCVAGMCQGTPIPGCCELATECDDGDACTDDICANNKCKQFPNYDTSRFCCNPDDGSLTPIDDQNICTEGLCDPETGVVQQFPAEAGLPCDDGNECTVDVCDENGQCTGTDLDGIPCTSDDDCSDRFCDLAAGFCRCSAELCLEIDVDTGLCVDVGDEVLVNAVLRHGATVDGGQFLVGFDPTVMEFIDAEPGDAAFVELLEPIIVAPGRVFYMLVPSAEGTSVTGPIVLATFRFRAIASCSTTDFRFLNESPRNTVVTLAGTPVDAELCVSDMLTTSGDAPVLDCPDSVSANADPGRLAASVTWDMISVVSGCDVQVNLTCTATHNLGWNIDHLIPTGGLIPSGVSTFECAMSNDVCGGGGASCSWVVNVSSANTVSVDVQLSPMISHLGPLQRCIEFEFFADCASEPEIFRTEIDFGLPFDLPGNAKNVFFKIPANKYLCVTARDPLHTLRAVADLEIVGDHWHARFQGDPLLGGNWLIGGNVNMDRVIDLLDLATVRAHLGETLTPSTNCARNDVHADVNGDGVVDILDELFVTENFLETDKETCCPSSTNTAAILAGAITEISVKELRRRGLGHLAAGDINGDGWLNMDDLYGPVVNAPVRSKRRDTGR